MNTHIAAPGEALPKVTDHDEQIAIRDRSYRFRPEAGDNVILRYDEFLNWQDEDGEYVRLVVPAGTVAYVGQFGTSNAGFRGLEATVAVVHDGRTFRKTISTGKMAAY